MADVSSPDIDDVILVDRIRRGDQDAMRLLLRSHGSRVQGALTKRFGEILSDYEIEEAIQDAALKVWTAIGTYDSTVGVLRAWFYRIAFNAACDILRRDAGHRHSELQTEPGYTPADL